MNRAAFAHGCEQTNTDPTYKVVTNFEALGHTLMSTGSCEVCFQATIRAAWKQFWQHVSLKCSGRSPVVFRMDFMTRYIRPIIVYRCARWPYSKHRARLLDIVQRKMLRIVAGIRRLQDETSESFARRSARKVADLQSNQGCWSVLFKVTEVNLTGAQRERGQISHTIHHY